MNFSNSVKIIDQSLVSPPPLPAGEARPSLPLTFFDMLWLNCSPVERLFFYQYPNSTSDFLQFHLPILKSSLSFALSAFYPLAATVRRLSDGHFQFATADSDSVPLTISEYLGDAADFLDISADHSRPIRKLLPLAPQLPKSHDSQPLFAVQVTLFPNYGLCVAHALHHSACDGLSSMQFVKFWAATAASDFRPEAPPVIDRALIPDPRNLYLQMERAVLDERAEEKMVNSGMDDGVFAATFTLSATDIGRLKKAVEKGMPGLRCSTFIVSCAYSWICHLKTRRITDGEGKAHLLFAVDWRQRSRAVIPANYFGNCVSGCFVEWDAEELMSKDGILIACAAIGKGIEELGDDPNECVDGELDRLAAGFATCKPLSLAGSPKLGVYEVDFGWGKARKVEVISTRETGAIAIAESRDGEGGIEIGVILPEKDLNTFAKYFAAGPDCLSD